MSTAFLKKALLGGFNGSGGGGSDDPLDLLLEQMRMRAMFMEVHPIFALHYNDYLKGLANPDLKRDACVRLLEEMSSHSIRPRQAASLEIVMDDFPDGPLAQAVKSMEISDLGVWLEQKVIKPQIIRGAFGKPKLHLVKG